SHASDALSPLSEEVHQMDAPALLAADRESITIQWKPVDGATGYRLRFRSLAEVAWTEVPATIANTSARKKNLSQGQGYVFSVIPLGAEEYEYSLGSETLHVAEETGITFIDAHSQSYPS